MTRETPSFVLKLSFLLIMQWNRHFTGLRCSLWQDLTRIKARRYLISPYIFQRFSIWNKYGLSQQLLKLQLPFPGNFQTQLRFDSNLLFRNTLICFLDTSITCFDIQQLFFRKKAQVLQEHQWLSSCYLEPWYLYLVNFSFQAHINKINNFQTHKQDHPNKLLFGNSRLLHFLQYFHWGYVI